MVEMLGFSELTTEQIETLCKIAEDVARKHIQVKISSKLVDSLDIVVEAQGSKPLDLSVEINLLLNEAAKGIDADALVNEAVAQAHLAIENFLRTLI